MLLDISQLPPLLYPLANRFYRRYQRGAKVNRQHQVWVGKESEQIICSLCLQPVADGYWLTSLLVEPARRHRGYANALLTTIRHHYTGPIWLFCSPSLVPLYTGAGFDLACDLPESLADRLLRYQRHKELVPLVSC